MLIAACFAFVLVAAPQAPLQKVTSVEGVTEYRLPSNGLRVLTFPDPTRETFTMNVVYLAGSRHEDYGETGAAHLLEHLLFKGSPRHLNVNAEMTARGATNNASTWYDRTHYHEVVPAGDANLDWAIDFEADRMTGAFLKKSDLESEMTVVRNEFENDENDPAGILAERVFSTMFLWHNYGKSTIGARSDIENIPIERVRGFYERWYRPDNAIVILTGRFDEAKALALIAAKFGKVPKPKGALRQTYTREPAQDGERTVTLRRVGDVPAVTVAYHVPNASHADSAAVDVLSYLLGDVPSGRMHKGLVEKSLAAEAGAYTLTLREPGALAVWATVPKGGDALAVRDEAIRIVETFAKTPPTAEEVERARTDRAKNTKLTMLDSERMGYALANWTAAGDWRLFFLQRDRLAAVTPADVQRVASAYLKQNNRTSGVFLPTEAGERVEVPEGPDATKLVAEYKGGKAIAPGEAFDPSPANVDKRTTRVKLANGATLAMLPKKTRGETVHVEISLNLGNLKALEGRSVAGGVAGTMLMRGTTKHTRQEMWDLIDRLQANVYADAFATSGIAMVEVKKENLDAALAIAAELLKEPAFPAEELALLKEAEISRAEEQRNDPTALASNALYRHFAPFPPADVRYVQTPDEYIAALKKVTVEDLKAFHRDFYGASAAQIAVVGDFDPIAVRKRMEELFGSWTAKVPWERIEKQLPDVAPVAKRIDVKDKTGAAFYAALRVPMRDDDPDYEALLIGNQMLGGTQDGRLWSRIREKEGLSYGVGSWFNASSFEKRAEFGAYGIFAPENAAKFEAALREEIARALAEGFTAEELKRAKKGVLEAQRVARSEDRTLAGTLNHHSDRGRTFAWEAAHEARISALTNERILAVMKKILDPARLSTFTAGDFSKVTAAPAAPAMPAAVAK